MPYIPPIPFPVPNIPQMSSYLGRIPTGVPQFSVGGLGQASPYLGTPAVASAGTSITSRLASMIPGEVGWAGKAALPKAGAGLTAGWLGSKAIQKILPGSKKPEHVLSGAAQGAGAGFAAGALFAPETLGLSALAGGAIGGLAGFFLGNKKKETRPIDQLLNVMDKAGLSDDDQARYTKLYSVLNTVGGDTKDSRLQAADAVTKAVLQQFQQDQQSSLMGAGLMGAGGAGGMTPEQNAAMQAQSAAFLAPYAQQSIDTAKQAQQSVLKNLANMPEAYRGVMEAGAASQLAATTRLASAYAAQAQLAPQAYAIQQQQQQEQALARQLMQQSIAAQLAGTSSGGGDFQQLLAANQGT